MKEKALVIQCEKCSGRAAVVAKDFEYKNGKANEHSIIVCEKCGEIKRL